MSVRGVWEEYHRVDHIPALQLQDNNSQVVTEGRGCCETLLCSTEVGMGRGGVVSCSCSKYLPRRGRWGSGENVNVQ